MNSFKRRMKIYKTSKELACDNQALKAKGMSIGFVPTMGALHEGHISLVNQAKRECDIVVVSIFVNPTQFNNTIDLEKYPRTTEADIKLLEQNSADIVFIPEYSEIYPDENSTQVKFSFGNLDKVMEGKYRPGHFNGVAMVVKRLFEIVKPTKAYFGQKDVQQFAIINHLNNNYLQQLNIKLVKCPIVREEDGLALSSRNRLLNAEQRKNASVISQELFAARQSYKTYSVLELKNIVKQNITEKTKFEVEYFEIVDDENLKKISDWNEANKILACIAVNVTDSLRLIDNVYFT